MPKIILRCIKCGKYTLSGECSCGGKTIDPRPAKYSVEDKWGEWRRKYKKNEF